LRVKILVIIAALLVLFWVWPTLCNAGDGKTGTRSAQFLKLGPGGRAVAMGGAFAGLVDDATAIYWNPAGLANLSVTELGFTHLAWFQDISYEFFVHAQPIRKWGVIGWSLTYLHMGELEGRDEKGEPTSDFSASGMAITFAFGRRMSNNLLFGCGIKSIEEKIEEQSSYSLALDFGLLYKTPIEGLCLGGVIQNWGRDMKFVQESFGLPTVFKLASSYRQSLAGNPINLTMDVYLPSDNQTGLHWGTEYIYRNTIAGRIGYKTNSDLGEKSALSFGLGITATRGLIYRIDYAFVPQGFLGDSHTFSLLISF
jgi:hypothetical protein